MAVLSHVPVGELQENKDRIVRRHFHREDTVAVGEIDQPPKLRKGPAPEAGTGCQAP